MTRRSLVLLAFLAACASRQAAPGPTAPAAPDPPAVGGSTVDSATPAEPPRNPNVITLEPVRIDVVASDTGSRVTVYDARELLDEGNDLLMQRRYDEALAAYDHLLRDFPESRLVIPALYNAGLALEGKLDFGGAAHRYRQLLERAPADLTDVVDAQFRLGAVLAEAEQYAESIKIFEQVLQRNDLSPEDRIEALARLGYALLETRDYAGAEEVLRSALGYHRELTQTRDLEETYYVAMCQYYLAAIPHRQFSQVPLRLPEEQLDRDVEHKSELILLARDRYLKTVEYKDPYWATAAVFQIGLMHKQFWDDFMAVPVPPNLSPEEAEMYVKLVNENEELRKLLEKSLLYHERNVAMAKRVNVHTPWVDASREEAEKVKAVLARQQKGELIRPGQSLDGVEAVDPLKAGTRSVSSDYIPERLNL